MALIFSTCWPTTIWRPSTCAGGAGGGGGCAATGMTDRSAAKRISIRRDMGALPSRWPRPIVRHRAGGRILARSAPLRPSAHCTRGWRVAGVCAYTGVMTYEEWQAFISTHLPEPVAEDTTDLHETWYTAGD